MENRKRVVVLGNSLNMAGVAATCYCFAKSIRKCTNWQNLGNATGMDLSDQGLTPATTYYWHVRAVTAGSQTTYGNGSPTAFWSFKTAAYPDAFKLSAPKNGAANQHLSLTLRWAGSRYATGYELCYSTTDYSSNPDGCGPWSSVTTARINLSGLTANTKYYWQVRAVNALGSTYAGGPSFWTFTTGSTP